jgi:hypothetical protein
MGTPYTKDTTRQQMVALNVLADRYPNWCAKNHAIQSFKLALKESEPSLSASYSEMEHTFTKLIRKKYVVYDEDRQRYCITREGYCFARIMRGEDLPEIIYRFDIDNVKSNL